MPNGNAAPLLPLRPAHPPAALPDDALGVLLALREHVARDPQVRSVALKVLLYLLPELLDRRYQPVKQFTLARELQMHQAVVSRALRRLVVSGLLERGPQDGTLKTYRVSASLLFRLDYTKRKSSAP